MPLNVIKKCGKYVDQSFISKWDKERRRKKSIRQLKV